MYANMKERPAKRAGHLGLIPMRPAFAASSSSMRKSTFAVTLGDGFSSIIPLPLSNPIGLWAFVDLFSDRFGGHGERPSSRRSCEARFPPRWRPATRSASARSASSSSLGSTAKSRTRWPLHMDDYVLDAAGIDAYLPGYGNLQVRRRPPQIQQEGRSGHPRRRTLRHSAKRQDVTLASQVDDAKVMQSLQNQLVATSAPAAVEAPAMATTRPSNTRSRGVLSPPYESPPNRPFFGRRPTAHTLKNKHGPADGTRADPRGRTGGLPGAALGYVHEPDEDAGPLSRARPSPSASQLAGGDDDDGVGRPPLERRPSRCRRSRADQARLPSWVGGARAGPRRRRVAARARAAWLNRRSVARATRSRPARICHLAYLDPLAPDRRGARAAAKAADAGVGRGDAAPLDLAQGGEGGWPRALGQPSRTDGRCRPRLAPRGRPRRAPRSKPARSRAS